MGTFSISIDDCYRLIFENSMDAILLTSPDGRIHRVNKATCTMFQRTAEEICRIGRDGLIDISDPRLKIMLEDRATKGEARGELTFIKKDGRKFQGECTSVMFQDNNGENWTSTIIRDVTIFKETEENLRRIQEETLRLASSDHLTGALNRRGFIQRLLQEQQRAKFEKTITGIMLIDIDYFKEVNDTYGHLTGDFVLQKFALCISESLRPYDVLGRYGGDEFIVYLPNIDIDESVAIALRIRSKVENTAIIVNSQQIRLTASFGIASLDCTESESIDSLISRADYALYRAKTKRNLIVTDYT
ncbi:MAG: sensor domain-containing diguanylate cyclase [Bacillota bacterium]|nr:sensor domain-containing diguanylate cyclase [Bacillota bacterium]MDP4160569.1 sensor domain-containing diguanylate cyclase [Bacillota bacterium]